VRGATRIWPGDAARAETSGLTAVMTLRPGIDDRRLFSERPVAGFDTMPISSQLR
jgi:hypothetical protein